MECKESGKCNWTKTKTCLAEYFNWIAGSSNVPGGQWNPIENCFLVNNKPLIKGSLTKVLCKQRKSEIDSEQFRTIKKEVEKYREDYKKRKVSLDRIKRIIENYYNLSDLEQEVQALKTINIILAAISKSR